MLSINYCLTCFKKHSAHADKLAQFHSAVWSLPPNKALQRTLRDIIQHGANLTLNRPIDHNLLRELASLATKTGARLTLKTDLPPDLILDLLAIGADHLSFVDG